MGGRNPRGVTSGDFLFLQGLLLPSVGRMQVKINAAHRHLLIVRLAEDDGYLAIEGNTVSQTGSTADVGVDGLLEQ